MEYYYEIFVELVIGYIALLAATRVMGKTTITQISTFDFIGVLILGDLVGAAMYVKETNWRHMLFTITVWATIIYGTALVTQKFRKSRSLFEGQAAVIIFGGKVQLDVMKKNLIDLDQLTMLLRAKDVFSFTEVRHAIIETNGDISVIKKTRNEKVRNLSYLLIQDGEINTNNLETIGKSLDWLTAEIAKKQFNDPKKVFIAEWNDLSGLFVQGYPN